MAVEAVGLVDEEVVEFVVLGKSVEVRNSVSKGGLHVE